jgi:hypothetical protein
VHCERKSLQKKSSIAIRKRNGNLFSGNGGADMRTTILAYVIAVLGFVMICGGIYSFFDLWNARAPLRHYAITIGMICGGFAMGGTAQALRQLLVIVYTLPAPH